MSISQFLLDTEKKLFMFYRKCLSSNVMGCKCETLKASFIELMIVLALYCDFERQVGS